MCCRLSLLAPPCFSLLSSRPRHAKLRVKRKRAGLNRSAVKQPDLDVEHGFLRHAACQPLGFLELCAASEVGLGNDVLPVGTLDRHNAGRLSVHFRIVRCLARRDNAQGYWPYSGSCPFSEAEETLFLFLELFCSYQSTIPEMPQSLNLTRPIRDR